MALEPVDCLRVMVCGADAWFCLRLALDLAARREHDTDS